MRILCCGGAGYVGSVLIPRLLARGYDVDVVDLLWFGNHLPKTVGFVHKDLFSLTESDLHRYEQVIFLAGLSNDPMAAKYPAQNFIYNAAAPAYLAYVAKGAGVKRYIYASSCSVYGYTENELHDETRAVCPKYPYGISKLQGEQACLAMADSNFSVIALRKGTISGYSPRMRFDLVINAMFRGAYRDKIIRVHNPAIWRPILSIQDAATAYIRAIESHSSISGIFNIASGNFTIGEIADMVQAQVSGKTELIVQHMTDLRNYKVSTTKAANVLSFHPKGDIRAIVCDLQNNLGEFLSGKKSWDDPEYFNIQQISRVLGLHEVGYERRID